MNDTRKSHQPIACLNLALERNNQLFSEAQSLRYAALDILDRPYLDTSAFSQYQEKRRHADLKYDDAIEHLRSLMTQYHLPRPTQHLR
ncbi:hypothetical protein PS914_05725 [Pseudomonas fluorescens]|uniref:hypothetical protein n=1 Tax=Pseudomonas fluorescens TaxID=294 RepID=UPI00123F9C1F|nr:hypothetical protein [Pseudomonas fluorescens]VVQ15372.1 hypothetical protein PS914_05725 [Pseudomonas fluorescens]